MVSEVTTKHILSILSVPLFIMSFALAFAETPKNTIYVSQAQTYFVKIVCEDTYLHKLYFNDNYVLIAKSLILDENKMPIKCK